MKSILKALILLLPVVLFSQESEYAPLVPQGEIPEDFLKTSTQIVDEEKNEFTASTSKKEQKLKEKFLIQSTFGTNDILQTGIVSFNDPVTQYINTIADNILKDDPKLRGEIRLYAAKLSSANAMTFNNGIILINLGLIAQLENESQLAYVICHEISHYINQDAINKFIEFDAIQKGKGIYKSLSHYDKEIQQFTYSKETETIADEDGLDMFLNSPYDVDAVTNVFDILKYSYLPIDEIPFKKEFLETANYRVKSEFVLDEVNPIDAEEGDDKEQTHPNTTARKEHMDELLANKNTGGNQVFVQDEELFYAIRKTSQFELSRIYLKYGWYEAAIYNSYVLLQKYPNDFFLQTNVAKSLAAIAMHVNTNEDLNSEPMSFRRTLQGESHQVYHIIDRMINDDEIGMNILAISKVYELLKANPDNNELNDLFEDLVYNNLRYGHIDFDKFKKNKPEEESPAEEEAIEEVTQNSTKSEGSRDDGNRRTKLENIEKQMADSESTSFVYSFVDYMGDDKFTETFTEAEKRIKDERDWESKWSMMKKKERIKNYNPWNIEKVVVIDPFFAKIGAKKKEKYKFFESESGEIDYTDKIEEIANHKKIDLEVEILDAHRFEEGDVEAMNDLFLANEWFSEQARLDEDIEYSSIEKDKIDDLIERHGTEYFMWSGVLDLKDRNGVQSFFRIYLGIIFPPALLFTVPKAITKNSYTVHFNIIKNLETGQTLYANVEYLNFKTQDAILNAKVFEELHKISKL